MSYMHIPNTYRAEGQYIFLFKECYALEKIHGTSAHLSWHDGKLNLSAGGESAVNFANLFNKEQLNERFRSLGYEKVVVYGEAYGGKQQAQGWRYGKQLKFVAFDVTVNGEWLDVPKAHDIVTKILELEFVHYARVSTDLACLDAERDAPSEQAKRNGVEGDKPREGVVLRPLKEFMLGGQRIIAKHKRQEERETATPRVVDDPAKLKVLEDAEAIAAEWVTPTRLQHVLDKVTSDPQMSDTPKVIAAMVEDVLREGAGEIVDTTEARKAISKATAIIFKRHVSKIHRAKIIRAVQKNNWRKAIVAWERASGYEVTFH